MGQTSPSVARGRGGSLSSTTTSRVIVAHAAGALLRTSLACHLPATGLATSANQE
jgi:hypothetical protein